MLSFSFYPQYNCHSKYRYNHNYLRLYFDSIAYFSNNMGEHHVFVVNIHTCKCTLFIWVPLRSGLSHWYIIHNNKGWLFVIVLHSFTGLCDIVQFLLNTVINVTSFVQGMHRVFVINIVTCKCAISILQILLFGVSHRC